MWPGFTFVRAAFSKGICHLTLAALTTVTVKPVLVPVSTQKHFRHAHESVGNLHAQDSFAVTAREPLPAPPGIFPDNRRIKFIRGVIDAM
jgi:hypothetical protein